MKCWNCGCPLCVSLWNFIYPGSRAGFEPALNLLHTSKLGQIPAGTNCWCHSRDPRVASVTSVSGNWGSDQVQSPAHLFPAHLASLIVHFWADVPLTLLCTGWRSPWFSQIPACRRNSLEAPVCSSGRWGGGSRGRSMP